MQQFMYTENQMNTEKKNAEKIRRKKFSMKMKSYWITAQLRCARRIMCNKGDDERKKW